MLMQIETSVNPPERAKDILLQVACVRSRSGAAGGIYNGIIIFQNTTPSNMEFLASRKNSQYATGCVQTDSWGNVPIWYHSNRKSPTGNKADRPYAYITHCTLATRTMTAQHHSQNDIKSNYRDVFFAYGRYPTQVRLCPCPHLTGPPQ